MQYIMQRLQGTEAEWNKGFNTAILLQTLQKTFRTFKAFKNFNKLSAPDKQQK